MSQSKWKETHTPKCYECERLDWKEEAHPTSHEPEEDMICASCNKSYRDGCKKTHHHSGFACGDIQDIRTLWCGCYAHKECQKDGDKCIVHGQQKSEINEI